MQRTNVPLPALKDLQRIPGIGPSLARDLFDLGIKRISQLRRRNPETLYIRLCALRRAHQDRCVLYTFRCAVYFVSNSRHDPECLKWWNWSDDADPEAQLATFIARFTPEIAALAKAALAKMRKRLPHAIQMVYDNYNFLVIGFGPTERASQAIFSIALYARGVNLFFLQAGPKLPDPGKLLNGNGKTVRHIPLKSPADLDHPAVKALINHALKRAPIPLNPTTPGQLIIKSISAKQRPRRPAQA